MIRQGPILAMRQYLSLFRLHFRVIFALILIALQVISIGVRVIPSFAHSEPINVPQLSSIFTPEVRHWSPLIYAWADAYDVDPNLIATIIQIESCGDPQAVSGSGAQGLFQVMPFHFKAGEDMLEVLTNGRRGMEYLASGLALAAGDPGLALAGYNGGHSLIKAGWARWPAETRRYYEWGTTIYKDAVAGLTSSPNVDKWLKAGGLRLCQNASQHQLIAVN